jgi:flagellar hook-basal body complex protein FliE
MTAPSATTSITVTPSAAAEAYRRTASGGDAGAADGFGAVLDRTLQSAVATGHDADAKAAAGLQGQGDLTEVVTAVSKAELALQSATAIRDRVVQAYQDIMRMPI